MWYPCTTYVHSIQRMYMYKQSMCTWYNQLSQQVFVASTEMQLQDGGISLGPLMQGTMRMRAVPVQKMVIFFMPGQNFEKACSFLHAQPATDPVPPDQCEVASVALSDSNLNVPCESGIRYPSMLVMLNRWQTQCKMSVMFCLLIHLHTKL
jgi:hypothetical protein